jgi:uncharacterized membrane protein
MGPPFSLAIAAIGLCLVALAAFGLLSFFRSPKIAAVLALRFAVGAFLGAGIGIVSAIPVIGLGPALNSSIAVVAYLGWLCVVAVVCGFLSMHLASRVLTFRSNGRLRRPLS